MLAARDNEIEADWRLDPLAFVPERTELMRYLGYRGEALKRSLPREVEQEVVEGFALLEPRGISRVHVLQKQNSNQLVIAGQTIAGRVAGFLEGAERVAVFVVTVGDAISGRSRAKAQEGDPVGAWVLDAVGSYATEAAAEALWQRLQLEVGPEHSLSPRYSPGYCGMDLVEQRTLFRLVDATKLGVALLPSMLMQPTKSVSGVLGIGAPGLFEDRGTPCARCGMLNCGMRRD